MALPFEELEAITNDYFMADGGKAVDIYFNTSFLLNYLMQKQSGLWERPNGGEKIRVPLEYDGQPTTGRALTRHISSGNMPTPTRLFTVSMDSRMPDAMPRFNSCSNVSAALRSL
jgi:hypothetical protein